MPDVAYNPSYTSSWADYGPMLEEFKLDKERWELFLREQAEKYPVDDEGEWDFPEMVSELLLNLLRGSIAIAEFVVANPEYFKGE